MMVSMLMIVVMVMVMMVMMVPVAMIVAMPMLMIMLVMMDPLPWPRTPRVFVEDQRFDRHRHRVGGHADAAEVDVVEIPQHDAVDHQQFAFDVALLAQDVTKRL